MPPAAIHTDSGIPMKNTTAAQSVVVTDVHMRFDSMVSFMVKWALASVPAVVILILIVYGAIEFAEAMLQTFGH